MIDPPAVSVFFEPRTHRGQRQHTLTARAGSQPSLSGWMAGWPPGPCMLSLKLMEHACGACMRIARTALALHSIRPICWPFVWTHLDPPSTTDECTKVSAPRDGHITERVRLQKSYCRQTTPLLDTRKREGIQLVTRVVFAPLFDPHAAQRDGDPDLMVR